MIAGMLIGAFILAAGLAAGYAAAIHFSRKGEPKVDLWQDYRDDKGRLSRRKVGEVGGRKER